MKSNFEQLYSTYYMQVYSYVMTLVGSRQRAEELTQQTFFKVLTSNSQHRGEASPFTWLCAIAKNLLADELRARRRFGESIDSGGEPEHLVDSGASSIDIESAIVDRQSCLKVHKVLHELEEPYKEVFQLRVFGELPFKRIAALFGKTENWARVTYHRARLKISERLDGLTD